VLHLLAHHQNKIESSILERDTEVRDSLSKWAKGVEIRLWGSVEKKEKDRAADSFRNERSSE